ncbi:MAG: DUF2789 family protein [Rugosibacter sp.]|nr:DUF2789 family protein [Rugosibacter sp.]
MEDLQHTFSEFFAQLGLLADGASIEAFIAANAPLPHQGALADAPFRVPAQALFLREALEADADSAELIDLLDARLHQD